MKRMVGVGLKDPSMEGQKLMEDAPSLEHAFGGKKQWLVEVALQENVLGEWPPLLEDAQD